MLRLRCETPQAWLDHALAHIDEVLEDHAHCEKKAAATALSLLSSFPDRPELALPMAALAEEESGHLRQVIEALHKRGRTLGRDPGDPYVQALLDFVKGGKDRLLDRLLVSACIEARSCERLKLLADHVTEPELKAMYTEFFRRGGGPLPDVHRPGAHDVRRGGERKAARRVAGRGGADRPDAPGAVGGALRRLG